MEQVAHEEGTENLTSNTETLNITGHTRQINGIDRLGNKPECWLIALRELEHIEKGPRRKKLLQHFFARSRKNLDSAEQQQNKQYSIFLAKEALFLGEIDPEEGRHAFQRAVALCKSSAMLYMTYAQFELQQGHKQTAHEILLQGETLCPNSEEILSAKKRLDAVRERMSMIARSNRSPPLQNITNNVNMGTTHPQRTRIPSKEFQPNHQTTEPAVPDSAKQSQIVSMKPPAAPCPITVPSTPVLRQGRAKPVLSHMTPVNRPPFDLTLDLKSPASPQISFFSSKKWKMPQPSGLVSRGGATTPSQPPASTTKLELEKIKNVPNGDILSSRSERKDSSFGSKTVRQLPLNATGPRRVLPGARRQWSDSDEDDDVKPLQKSPDGTELGREGPNEDEPAKQVDQSVPAPPDTGAILDPESKAPILGPEGSALDFKLPYSSAASAPGAGNPQVGCRTAPCDRLQEQRDVGHAMHRAGLSTGPCYPQPTPAIGVLTQHETRTPSLPNPACPTSQTLGGTPASTYAQPVNAPNPTSMHTPHMGAAPTLQTMNSHIHGAIPIYPYNLSHTPMSNNLPHLFSYPHHGNSHPSPYHLPVNPAPCRNPVCAPMRDKKTMVINGVTYVLLKVVGKGGSSKVFQALKPTTCEIVAVKQVNLVGCESSVLEGYKNEIKFLKKLQGSDHIIRLLDYEICEENLFLVMECGSIDMSAYLKKLRSANRKMERIYILGYWTFMLKAVEMIHKHGVIHLDLKPANFMFVDCTLKLIDFGIANAIQVDATSIIKDTQVGTLNYMAPETINDMSGGAQHGGTYTPKFKVGPKADVWSLGCILYYMMYGRTPFQHIQHQAMKLFAITNEKHKIEFPDYPCKELLEIVQACLIRDPKKRPSVDMLLDHPLLK